MFFNFPNFLVMSCNLYVLEIYRKKEEKKNQRKAGIKHPFDLNADHIGGSFRKNDKCELNENRSGFVYAEVHRRKNQKAA